MFRRLTAATIGITAALALTACDPPMPPSVIAQLAEQTFTCYEGDAKVKLIDLFADSFSQLRDAMASSCVDPLPLMTMSATSENNANIVISDYPQKDCQALVTVPVAADAAELAFALDVTTDLYLSPSTIAGIFNGEITSWDNPKIASENPDTQFPSEPIQVSQVADKLAFDAMNAWLTHFGHPITKKYQLQETDIADAPTEGQIAIRRHSTDVQNGLTPAMVIVGGSKKNPIFATADAAGVGSATSQWADTKTAKDITVKMDYKKPAIIPDGVSVAAPSYQAIFPINLTICGKDDKRNRATAAFMLRMDSQGVISSSNFYQLSEETRVNSVALVRVGLPKPKLPKQK
jgi:hypothetical protein